VNIPVVEALSGNVNADIGDAINASIYTSRSVRSPFAGLSAWFDTLGVGSDPVVHFG
jgi:hypothetical protein